MNITIHSNINNHMFSMNNNNFQPHPNLIPSTTKPSTTPSIAVNADSYLQPYHIPHISNLDFNTFLTSNFESNDLKEVKQTITSLPIITDGKQSIGPFCYLAQLVELSYNFEPNLHNKMLSQYKRLYSTIYKYRKVKGDGNCYYRAIIFSYLEHIILSSNLQLLQNIIYDIKQCYDNKLIINKSFINSTTKIKPQLLLKIMILIYVSLKKNQIETTYELFNKAMNNCVHFDHGLVLYFRYILYRYIKSNETKFYKKDFGIQIGNLLPSQYETSNGLFLFEDFYNNYLLKMNQDTEKIVIYITPFVLCCKVNVLIFDCEYENNHNEFEYGDKDSNGSIGDDDYGVLLISNKEHYEIGYCKNYYSRYKNVFQSYKAQLYKNIILVEINNEKEEMNDIDLLAINNSHSGLLSNSYNESSSSKGTNIDLMPLQFNGHNTSNGNGISSQSLIETHPNSMMMMKCLKCNQNTNLILQSFDICAQCFNSEFLSQVTSTYLKCQKSFKSFFKTNKSASEYIRMLGQMFNTTKITINKRQISIDQAIQLHNQTSQNKIYLNTYLTQIKTVKCLNCASDIINPTAKVSLPCMCFMCSGQCLNEYYSTVNKIEYRRQKEYCCHCGTIYEAYQLLSLALLLSQFQFQSIKNDVLLLHKNILKGKCSKCQVAIPVIEDKIVVNCSNTRNEIVNLLGIHNFNHSLCKKCYSSNNHQKIYFCLYCRCDHEIIKQMSCNSDEGFI